MHRPPTRTPPRFWSTASPPQALLDAPTISLGPSRRPLPLPRRPPKTNHRSPRRPTKRARRSRRHRNPRPRPNRPAPPGRSRIRPNAISTPQQLGRRRRRGSNPRQRWPTTGCGHPPRFRPDKPGTRDLGHRPRPDRMALNYPPWGAVIRPDVRGLARRACSCDHPSTGLSVRLVVAPSLGFEGPPRSSRTTPEATPAGAR